MAPRRSTFLNTESSNGSSISLTGSLPIQGNTSFSRLLMTSRAWIGVQRPFCNSNHARATVSKSLAAERVRSAFALCASIPGSRPLQRACRVPPLAGVFQRNIGIRADHQSTILAAKSVFQAPGTVAALADEEMQSPGIGELVILAVRRGILDQKIGQRECPHY